MSRSRRHTPQLLFLQPRRHRVPRWRGYVRRAALHGALIAGAVVAFGGAAVAQQGGIVKSTSAVVTGFSGTTMRPPPAGATPADATTINPQGPAARVIDLSSLGSGGQLAGAPKTFTVTAGQVGQVFGIALDDAPNPDIFLAATAAYGLEIGVPDGAGGVRRIRRGTNGANFVPGQFGQGGGPGSIWRVDGTNGSVSLFATIGTAGPAALGGLAFDPRTRQIFAADRATGIVYRLSLSGTMNGTYDHGVEGRFGAGLTAFPRAASSTPNVTTGAFDTESSSTWGLAAPARRVFALTVHDNRLYYSVAQGPQIWSAGIAANGTIPGNDARLEVEVPALQDGVEITSIAFDRQGLMYVAERGATTGDYSLLRLANSPPARVLRYPPKQPGDSSPGEWAATPEQYSVGLAPDYNNADGGVALGYGYRPERQRSISARARQSIWTTGSQLLGPLDPNAPQNDGCSPSRVCKGTRSTFRSRRTRRRSKAGSSTTTMPWPSRRARNDGRGRHSAVPQSVPSAASPAAASTARRRPRRCSTARRARSSTASSASSCRPVRRARTIRTDSASTRSARPAASYAMASAFRRR